MSGGARERLPLAAVILAGTVLFAALVWVLGFVPGPDKFVGYGNQILSTTTTVWSSHPLGSHGLLSFYDVGDFEKKLAYIHATPFHTGLFFLYTRLAMALSGKPVLEAQRYIAFLNLIAFVAAFGLSVAALEPSRRWSRRQLAIIFLFLGLFLTQYDFWAVKEGSPINAFPMIAALSIGALPFVLKGNSLGRGALWLAAGLGLLFPLYGMTLLLALWVVYHADRAVPFWARENRAVNLRAAAVLGAALVALAYPPLVASLLGFSHGGTPFLHRMGLDGQRSLYQNYWQALVKPLGYHYARPWSPQNPETRFVPQLLLLAGTLAFLGRPVWRWLTVGHVRALFVVASGWLMSFLLFPQSVSVHPYLYDILLSFPLVLAAFLAALSPEFDDRVRGFRWILFLMFVGGFLMFQLTDVAQVGFAKSGKPELYN